MFCPKCGANLPENSTFCSACGAQIAATTQPQPQAQPQPQVQPQAQPVYTAPEVKPATPGKGLAIAAMVTGILSFLCFPYVFGILGIVFGGVAKSKGCKSGMATAGIACGAVGIALWLLMLVACSSTSLMAGLM